MKNKICKKLHPTMCASHVWRKMVATREEEIQASGLTIEQSKEFYISHKGRWHEKGKLKWMNS
ncbi:hypothetical protein H5410_035815 [Solanum commersonii]|uniref:Uncharacterized protein n=1 Tax=Solanum commersonii TaxID=4109 RepID=A0A9J5Y3X7_SOLCO|nr:hypothetical protein H5410_035815 [Solanum commersonii]